MFNWKQHYITCDICGKETIYLPSETSKVAEYFTKYGWITLEASQHNVDVCPTCRQGLNV